MVVRAVHGGDAGAEQEEMVESKLKGGRHINERHLLLLVSRAICCVPLNERGERPQTPPCPPVRS